MENDIFEAQQKFNALENIVIDSVKIFFFENKSFVLVFLRLINVFEKIEAFGKNLKFKYLSKDRIFSFLLDFFPILESIFKLVSFIEIKKLLEFSKIQNLQYLPALKKIRIYESEAEKSQNENLIPKIKEIENISFDQVFNALCKVQDPLEYVFHKNNCLSFFRIFYMKADYQKTSLSSKMKYIR